MPEIKVRPAIFTDIPSLMAIDHRYTSDRVWQMEFNHAREDGQVGIKFREVRLPRAARVKYPRSARTLIDDWQQRSAVLVAIHEDEPIGYVSLSLNIAPLTTWATDLVVLRRLRRRGVGSALTLAALEWAAQMGSQNLILEMQPKNYPAIQLAMKLGFEFFGYNDRYYPKHGIGIFFGKALR